MESWRVRLDGRGRGQYYDLPIDPVLWTAAPLNLPVQEYRKSQQAQSYYQAAGIIVKDITSASQDQQSS